MGIHRKNLIIIATLIFSSCTFKKEVLSEKIVNEVATNEKIEVQEEDFKFYFSKDSDAENVYISWVVIRPKKYAQKEITFGMGILYQGQLGELFPENSLFQTTATTYTATPFMDDEIFGLSMVKNFCGHKVNERFFGSIPTDNAIGLKEFEDRLILIIEGEILQFEKSDWDSYIDFNSVARSIPCQKII